MPTRRQALSLIAAPWATVARAQSTASMHLVVAYPPGGPVDLLARQMEAPMRQALARPIVIDNVPGAAGGLGVARLLSAADPRTTMLVGSPSETVLAPLVNPVLTYQPEQLRLLGLVSLVPVALVGRESLAASSLDEVLDAARAANPPLSFGNYGVGSHAHVLGEDLSARTGIRLLHVPYGGVAHVLRDLLGGRVDLSFLPFNAQVQDLVAQRRLRLYGMASDAPVRRFPGTPVMANLTAFRGFRHGLWTGVFASRTTPAAACDEVRRGLRAVLADPVFRRQKLDEGVGVAAPMTGTEADRWFDGEVARYRDLTTRLAPQLRG